MLNCHAEIGQVEFGARVECGARVVPVWAHTWHIRGPGLAGIPPTQTEPVPRAVLRVHCAAAMAVPEVPTVVRAQCQPNQRAEPGYMLTGSRPRQMRRLMSS